MAARKATTKATPEVTEAPEENTFSAKDLAAEAGTDPKTFRRWLRAHYDRPNKGERWVFDSDTKAEVLDAYNKADAPVELTEID